MSDNQPRHRKPYEPHEPYLAPGEPGLPRALRRPDPYAQNTPQPRTTRSPVRPAGPLRPARSAAYGQQQGPVQGQPHEPYAAQQPHQPQQQPRQQQRWPAAGGRHAQYGPGQYGYDPPRSSRTPGTRTAPRSTPQPHGPQTQTWDAPTWETGTQQPVPAAGAETTHLPTQHQTAPPTEEPYARQHPQRAKPHPQGAAAARPAPLWRPTSGPAPKAARRSSRRGGSRPC